MTIVYRTGSRPVQPVKGVKLSGGTTIAQYCADAACARAWIAKQRNPALYHFA
jgi:hypothetical protein